VTRGACLFNPRGSSVNLHIPWSKSKFKVPNEPKSYKIHDASSRHNVVGGMLRTSQGRLTKLDRDRVTT
jgi:hypothetical protein